MYIRHLMVFLSLAAVLGCRHALAASLEDLAQRSQFVFQGTVTKLNAATLPQIRPTASTIIVKVDDVLHAPPAFLGDYSGKEITVQVSQPGIRRGEQFVFFTTSWMFGSNIAVREVGRMEPDITISRGRVTAALATAARNTLQNRVTNGELVVAGRISDVRPAPEQVRADSHTEHDPLWQEAVIQIEFVLKGHINDRRVVILFPGSNDVMWQSAPRFREGEQGIWVLRIEKIEKMPATHEHLTALNPLDFHPINN